MRLKLASALLALSAISVSGCGFTPVYGTNVNAPQGSIQIEQIEGSAGHVMRRELLMALKPGLPGVENGRLSIVLDELEKNFSFRQERDDIRTSITTVAKYKFYYDDQQIQGIVEGFSSYFTPDTPFGNISSRKEASNRAAMDAAQKLVSELQLKLAGSNADEYTDEDVFEVESESLE